MAKGHTGLAKAVLRGTPLDIFGYSAHRRMERNLVHDYESLVDRILDRLTGDNHAAAVELANLADMVRGYDVVKEANVAKMRERGAELWAKFESAARQTQVPSTPAANAHAA